MSKAGLGNFLINLAIDDTLRARFDADKEAVLAEQRDLSATERRAILAANRRLLDKRLLGDQHTDTRPKTRKRKTAGRSGGARKRGRGSKR